MPKFCSACGEALGNPTEALHDPEGRFWKEPVDNPDSHHVKVVDAPHDQEGTRLMCANTGQMMKLEDSPPDEEGSPSGDTGSKEPKPNPGPDPKNQEVYDLPQEKSAMDILKEVASTPVFELNEPQVDELLSWGDIYDGQIPPDQVEAILANFSGVSKQTASLIRQKYEAKLNRWMQKRARDSGGPQIGGSSPPLPQPPNRQRSRGGSNKDTSSSSEDTPDRPTREEIKSSTEDEPSDPLEMSKERRSKRQSRRQKMMDEAMDQFAHSAADNLAGEIGQGFGQFRDVLISLLRSKAEKDPDWFFEKMDEWDMDLFDEFMSMSEARREELKESAGSDGFSVDMDIDNALSDVQNNTSTGEDEMQGGGETPKSEGGMVDNEDPLSASGLEDDFEEEHTEEPTTDEDEAFEELIGDVTSN